MLNKEQLEEFDQLVALNQKADVRENKEKILVLLREFTRRSFLWSKLIKENNISIRDHIVNDFAFLITGRKIEIPKIFFTYNCTSSNMILKPFSKYLMIKIDWTTPKIYFQKIYLIVH